MGGAAMPAPLMAPVLRLYYLVGDTMWAGCEAVRS